MRWFAWAVGRSKIRRSLIALSGHRLLSSLAASLLSLYLPIYFYTHFNYSLRLVVLFYIAGHVLYAALIPVGARFFSRFGMRTSLIVLVSMALQLVVGHFLDYYPKRKLLRTHSYYTALGWFLMAFVDSVGQFFAVSTYRNVSGSLADLSFQAFFYEHAADSGHYIDEYTALQEIASHSGRAAIGIILIATFGWFGLRATFVAAALLTLLVTVLSEQNLGRKIIYGGRR